MAQDHKVILLYKGRLMSFRELSRVTGLSVIILKRRFFAGIHGDAIAAPVRERRKITWSEYLDYVEASDVPTLRPAESILIRYQGKLRSLAYWSKKLGLLENVLLSRFERGFRGERLFRYPNSRPLRKLRTHYEKQEFNDPVNAATRRHQGLLNGIMI